MFGTGKDVPETYQVIATAILKFLENVRNIIIKQNDEIISAKWWGNVSIMSSSDGVYTRLDA